MIRFHDALYRDLNKLSKSELTTFHKKRRKIRNNPERQKHLAGGTHCYREPITKNIRLIYYLHGQQIWLLTVAPHDQAYGTYRQRLQSLQGRLD